jgi:hypothetical protein
MDGMPTYERERHWAVLGLLVLVLVMGAGALGLAFSGYAWV